MHRDRPVDRGECFGDTALVGESRWVVVSEVQEAGRPREARVGPNDDFDSSVRAQRFPSSPERKTTAEAFP